MGPSMASNKEMEDDETPFDKLRILSGKPPVQILAAVKAMFKTRKELS